MGRDWVTGLYEAEKKVKRNRIHSNEKIKLCGKTMYRLKDQRFMKIGQLLKTKVRQLSKCRDATLKLHYCC